MSTLDYGRTAFIPYINIKEQKWVEIFEELDRDIDVVSLVMEFISEKTRIYADLDTTLDGCASYMLSNNYRAIEVDLSRFPVKIWFTRNQMELF